VHALWFLARRCAGQPARPRTSICTGSHPVRGAAAPRRALFRPGGRLPARTFCLLGL